MAQEKCKTCAGLGFERVDYKLTKEEIHAKCDTCNGKGKIQTQTTCTTCKGNHYIPTDTGTINCPVCVCNTFFAPTLTNTNKINGLQTKK